MADRDAREQLHRRVVVHGVLFAQHATVAVICVLAEAHVGEDEQLRQRALERARRGLNYAILVPCPRAF